MGGSVVVVVVVVVVNTGIVTSGQVTPLSLVIELFVLFALSIVSFILLSIVSFILLAIVSLIVAFIEFPELVLFKATSSENNQITCIKIDKKSKI